MGAIIIIIIFAVITFVIMSMLEKSGAYAMIDSLVTGSKKDDEIDEILEGNRYRNDSLLLPEYVKEHQLEKRGPEFNHFLIPSMVGEEGSKEDKEQFKRFINDKKSLRISDNLKLNHSKIFEHGVIIGPSGSGKSASVLKPMLYFDEDTYLDGVSIVCTDPKGELHHYAKKKLESLGFEVGHLNFNNVQQSVGYDLLQACASIEDVESLCESIMHNASKSDNDIWGDLSIPWLKSFTLRQYHLGGSISDVARDCILAPDDLDELELEYFSAGATADENSPLYYSFLEFSKMKQTAGSDKTLSSVQSTVNTALKVFTSKNVKFVEGNKEKLFNPSDLRDKKYALFISYDPNKVDMYSFFLAPFYKQLFEQLYNNFDETDEDAKMPVVFLLDEFANIGKLRGFDNILTTVRSRKMAIFPFIQSLSQLENLYGKKGAEIIFDNLKTKIILDSVTGSGAEQLSKLFGKKQIQVTSVNDTVSTGGMWETLIDNNNNNANSNNFGISTSLQEVDVLTPTEIKNIKSDQLIVLTANLNGVIDTRTFVTNKVAGEN